MKQVKSCFIQLRIFKILHRFKLVLKLSLPLNKRVVAIFIKLARPFLHLFFLRYHRCLRFPNIIPINFRKKAVFFNFTRAFRAQSLIWVQY